MWLAVKDISILRSDSILPHHTPSSHLAATLEAGPADVSSHEGPALSCGVRNLRPGRPGRSAREHHLPE